MAYIYRYTDLRDGIIKYVGIVWSPGRTLEDRLANHMSEQWFKESEYKIEYIEEGINTRTDAEYFEAHYISKYGTHKYYNKGKAGWGESEYLPDRENDWKEVSIIRKRHREIVSTLVDEVFFDSHERTRVVKRAAHGYGTISREEINEEMQRILHLKPVLSDRYYLNGTGKIVFESQTIGRFTYNDETGCVAYSGPVLASEAMSREWNFNELSELIKKTLSNICEAVRVLREHQGFEEKST